MKVFVTGATGMLGRAIIAALVRRGDSVVAVSRNPKRAALGSGVEVIEGDPVYAGAWQERIAGCDAVINLAGETIGGKKWNARQKQIIHDTRVDSTRFVVEAMARIAQGERPKVLISASAVDYYPFSLDLGAALAVDEDDDVDESCPPADSFLSRVCRNWEREAREAKALGVRVVTPRLGLVLGKGGVLDKMTGPFKYFVGGRLGNGRQWMSWVHIDDVVGVVVTALGDARYEGPINVVAPQPVRNAEFSSALGHALGRPSWLPVPGFVIRRVAGEIAEYLLNGRRVVPAALHRLGYSFEYPDLRGALNAALGK